MATPFNIGAAASPSAFDVIPVFQEEKAKAYKKEKQKERKRRAEDDIDLEEDDEMAAVMGFSGFGSSKKSH